MKLPLSGWLMRGGWSLLAFIVLGIRFSPNWVTFYHSNREARAGAVSPAQVAAIDRTMLRGYSERGWYVLRQARDLETEIENPVHQIVRWRLLMPALGHFLRLPGWLTLGLAHLGCLVLVAMLVVIGSTSSGGPARPSYEAWCLAVIAGATAPFFTSMGWLGYYDSWLALALLAVAFARSRRVVLLACLLAPWIDERFVIGLPLALLVRRIGGDEAPASLAAWFKAEAMLPFLLVACYSAVRLMLGGTSGSQTVGDYLNQFVFSQQIPVAQRLSAAWAGLRIGWVLVGAAIVGSGLKVAAPFRFQALLLAVGVAATAFVGLVTALDMSRSMVLLLPMVPLGWIVASRTAWWRRFCAGPLLAAAALCLPASHVAGNVSLPVDNFWSPSLPLVMAENNLGVMYARGEEVTKDAGEAVRWFRQAAEQGYAGGQKNLGLMYARGFGVAKDSAEAVRWLRQAADQGQPEAQLNLGTMYANGDGVAKNSAEAVKWFRLAADQGQRDARFNLGAMYANGEGVARDLIQAHVWFSLASAGDRDRASVAKILEAIEKEMPPGQIAEAKAREQDMRGKSKR